MLPPFHQRRQEVGAASGRAGTKSAPGQVGGPSSREPGRTAACEHLLPSNLTLEPGPEPGLPCPQTRLRPLLAP